MKTIYKLPNWKVRIIISLFLLDSLLLVMILYSNTNTNANVVSSSDIEVMMQDCDNELYKNGMISLLMPSIDKEIYDFYKEYLIVPPRDDPWFIDVIDIKSLSESNFTLMVTIETTPYLGPHNSVGRDQITYKIMPGGDIQLKKYEHLESYEIAPNYRDSIIEWPPENITIDY